MVIVWTRGRVRGLGGTGEPGKSCGSQGRSFRPRLLLGAAGLGQSLKQINLSKARRCELLAFHQLFRYTDNVILPLT